MRTLVRALTRVTSNMSFQLAQFNASIITFGTLVRFLMGMSVSHVTHQFTGCSERAGAIFATMGLGAGMRVDMILQAC